MASDLTAPATPAVLDGWCGPVVLRIDGHDAEVVVVAYRPATRMVGIAYERGHTVEGQWAPDDCILLDFGRAEVRDRVARVLAEKLVPGSAYGAPRWVYGTARPGWVLDCGPTFARRWFWREGSLADLDPSGRTLLPDGSRRVDALALRAVYMEVCLGE